MYAGQDWSPLEPGETDTFSLSFINDLMAGETLTNAVWTCVLVPQPGATDATPSARLNGSAAIIGPVTSQSISTCIAGNYYLLQATVTTSIGRILQAWSRFKCVNPS